VAGNITEVLVPMVMNYVNISLNMKDEVEEVDGEEAEEMEAEQLPNIQGEGEGRDEKQRRESGEGRGTINPTEGQHAGGADEEEGGGQKRRSRRNEGKEDQVNEAQGVGSTAEVEEGQGGKRERRKRTGKKEGESVGLVVAGCVPRFLYKIDYNTTTSKLSSFRLLILLNRCLDRNCYTQYKLRGAARNGTCI